MKKLVILGASGQLGIDLTKAANLQYTTFPLGKTDADITDSSAISETLYKIKPDIVVNCAAYTAVDKAEQDVDAAYSVNAYGARNIAVASEQLGAKYCCISTDYVFDGDSNTPYHEYDLTNPQSIYGKSKLVGEQLIQSISSKYFIVRTSWLYGLYGNNFVKTMLGLVGGDHEIRVVDDQRGAPTYTRDLANFILKLIGTELYGIYHATNAGECTWYDFAKKVFEIHDDKVNLVPCQTSEYPRPAPRPKYSVLGNQAIRINGFQPLRPWQDALGEFIEELRGAK